MKKVYGYSESRIVSPKPFARRIEGLGNSTMFDL